DSSQSHRSDPSISGHGIFYWKGGRKLTADLSLDSLSADTLVQAALFFLDGKKASKLKQYESRLSPFVADGNFSFSSDFKDLSYDLRSFSVKDRTEEGRCLSASLSGNRDSVDVQKLVLDYGLVHLKAQADATMSLEDKEVNFNASMDLNGIPYDFKGSFAKDRWFNLTGSYGIDILANLEDGASGTARILSFPVSFKNYEYAFSLDGDFNVKSLQDFNVNIKSLQVQEEQGKLNRSPKLALAGKLDPMGFIIDALSYSDINSSVGGKGYVLWNVHDGILESANVSIGMSNEFTKETITLAGDFSNPLRAKLTKETLLHDCYFSILSDIRGFPLMRFIPNQYADDTFNGSIIASGTVENPYVSAKLENFSIQLGTKPVIVNGMAELLEGDLFIPDLDIVWGGMRLTDFTTDLDLTSFNGDASGEYSMRVMGSHYIKVPLKLSVRNVDESQERHSLLERFVPTKFIIDVDSSVGCEGLMNGTIPFKGEVKRDGRGIYFATDSSLGVSGSFLTDAGALSVMVSDDKPLHGRADGIIKKSMIDLTIKDLKGDFSKLHDRFSTKSFGLYAGLASGFVTIRGMTSDPSLDGTLLIRNMEVGVPAVTQDHLSAKNMLLTFFGQNIEMPDCRVLAGQSRLDLSAVLRRERWGLSSLDVSAKTVENDRLAVKMAIPKTDIKGNVALDAKMHYESSTMKLDIDGSMEQGEVSIVTGLTGIRPIGTLVSLSGGTVREAKEDDGKPSLWESLTRSTDVIINVKASVGRKVDLVINPLLQALVNPGTQFEFSLDTSLSSWSMKSDVALRGGHITYLSRNFYIRNGLVSLNENEKSFNPLITARAETKERDTDGVVVTLVLESEKQSLSAFSPRIYSVPARSEAQIMAMLGQVVSGDSDNAGSFLLSGLDYGIQFTVFKKMENALRDLLNFDIFSVRMNLLQNALNFGRSESRKSYNGTFRSYSNPLGNFLDNASVYMGKYFGDSIYADALLQFTYDEYSEMTGAGVLGSGIVFRPEIGIELEAPFANIRWNFAPDLEALRYGNVPDIVAGNSITLSWRFTF
ncbi:MAG: translocation/assembly module TamB domain-containing protein, partial [Treponema sp.]|nr:translocation/assembly module TamB domain-containing protein [Treponema sp.]